MQKASPFPKYRTTWQIPIINLFNVFSFDLAGPLPTIQAGNRNIIICVEDLMDWPLALAISLSTTSEVLDVVQE